ncbi:MAG: hypothetical protein A3J07_01745 [Candidatus Doudnabacteria bacterium RIFCSPLOWO2_02_FULL_49_13]|uniref:Uncharacterized protein n=1 Tax=Candidatus Doudnabacteria bacterium RIFCSPHIGHO2_12_FULL_48_16 TaxID=1817838 RepID=A0A1F5PLI3_9BACT|nr:MAG: hypothetical protein A3B77_00970 [Candidatus Doudnabacteria bacterium RIFCSPHIGHO2_02_FULL_49_24]OGE88814.1 MAG: hypothetical protein A2760_01325 [Candidatus Doudnabacteria bacterium RIFCSPHIGHO2_01_FULL_50_67]OGE90664.1 MAG: hypothetical protein A3E29_00840 [Candidatus Doudnabacteria bacterium RIFCSPHIGHO2_12_FULL_48_16]OGF02530.1 MAG: hypothetical protein A3J07_01745 [Candidatus Doudnabacteria bacterium RIFCSPLOWO2_02_FULL_49_13]
MPLLQIISNGVNFCFVFVSTVVFCDREILCKLSTYIIAYITPTRKTFQESFLSLVVGAPISLKILIADVGVANFSASVNLPAGRQVKKTAAGVRLLDF